MTDPISPIPPVPAQQPVLPVARTRPTDRDGRRARDDAWRSDRERERDADDDEPREDDGRPHIDVTA